MRATFFWSALSTMLSVSRWRLRLVVFEVRIWRLKACPRLNLPVAVFLKRFAAPLWVLSFGITYLVYNKTTGTGHRGRSSIFVAKFRYCVASSIRRYCCCAGELCGGAAGGAGGFSFG